MLIRIGTNEYHISIGFMYYYEKGNILNLFEFSTAPIFFSFVISLAGWRFNRIWIESKKKMWMLSKKGITKW